MGHALIEEAAKKAAIAWLDGQAAWCAWCGDALYVVSGPGEQDLSLLTGATTVAVTLRGGHGGRVVTWLAEVSAVPPGGEEWQTVAPQLAGKRLNAVGGADDAVARWSARCTVFALRPATAAAPATAVAPASAETPAPRADAVVLEEGETLPSGSLAQPARPSAATRPVRRPFRLHRVRQHR